MKPTALPLEIRRLAREFRRELDATVKIEPIAPRRYRFAVTSPAFQNVAHLKRQDRIWEIVNRVLEPEKRLWISLVLAYAPERHDVKKPSRRTRVKASAA